MYRRTLEDALLDTFALTEFVIPNLHDHRKALHEEDATEYRQQQFLMDDDGTHTDDTTDRKTAGIAHEDLGGVSIIPQEANERSDKSTHKHHKLLRAGDIHDVQIGSKLHMRAHIGEDSQRHAYNRRVARAHAVHTIVEVGSIADGSDDEDGHDDEQNPSGSGLILAAERHDA